MCLLGKIDLTRILSEVIALKSIKKLFFIISLFVNLFIRN